MWTRFLFSSIVAVLLFVPTGVLGAVLISEVMYDLPDADEGREWVELHNTGNDAVDIADWKLSENGTNHSLTAVFGSVIPAGAYAVVADDTEKFSADWPNYRGVLFSSSFSLRNNGEMLSLKNASSSVVVSRTYEPSAGGRGNGNTLNWINDTPRERAPSPGAAPAAAALEAKEASVSERNPLPSSQVQNNDSAELSSGEAGVVSIIGGGETVAARVFQDNGFSGMIPWILALIAVIAIAGGAIFSVRKEKGSGYRIIEEEKK